ncbi:MAG: hypothetical protein HC924_14365 [Synechococcaceae cyanobacterium SM2_3_2]|nr:hypothetical protein [Synechococcaceae cyanobacterium SM2_3_2]
MINIDRQSDFDGEITLSYEIEPDFFDDDDVFQSPENPVDPDVDAVFFLIEFADTPVPGTYILTVTGESEEDIFRIQATFTVDQ